ncbi:hypothetical protein [Silvimonas sp.]|uniref:hypothetical protein n=1 Tax=Silvimonas sp. TaxID=2650811 RepID=UPI00283FE644|nr:hypothetical protein [Silvimonas sp.]MDR3429667.1 hypothetical protein [Silvimonas sp.]
MTLSTRVVAAGLWPAIANSASTSSHFIKLANVNFLMVIWTVISNAGYWVTLLGNVWLVTIWD